MFISFLVSTIWSFFPDCRPTRLKSYTSASTRKDHVWLKHVSSVRPQRLSTKPDAYSFPGSDHPGSAQGLTLSDVTRSNDVTLLTASCELNACSPQSPPVLDQLYQMPGESLQRQLSDSERLEEIDNQLEAINR